MEFQPLLMACGLGITIVSSASHAQTYDFANVTELLLEELPELQGHVAVIIRQDDVDLFSFQAGDIDVDTQTRMASLTKTISAGVVLALRDEGVLSLDDRFGDALLQFERNGLGDPTVQQAFGMQHGIVTPQPWEILRQFNLTQSVFLIGRSGEQSFPPGSVLFYDGNGMQVTGRMAELRSGQSWDELAQSRIFEPCSMLDSDYGQFDPNPAIAGGMRSSAVDVMNFATMVMNGGRFDDAPVLSEASVQRLFTNATEGLAVERSPWPATHPLYPYGADPDYGFGTWIFAQHPDTGHVEEIVGAGAWGSFVWMDRRRGLSAVLITDVPAGSQASMDAALGMMDLVRREIDEHQVTDLHATRAEGGAHLSWVAPDDAIATKVYGSSEPIRNIHALRRAALLTTTTTDAAFVDEHAHYAAIAVFDDLTNPALTPATNATTAPLSCLGDFNGNGAVGVIDLLAVLARWGAPGHGDFDASGAVDVDDLLIVLSSWGSCSP